MQVISEIFTIRWGLVSQQLSCSRCIRGRRGTVAAEWGTTVSNNFVLFGQPMRLAEGGGCGISQRRHTTSRHHCDGNVNKLWVQYNWNATNDSREVVEIVHTKKVRYYRLFIIYRDVLWISIIQSEAIWIKKNKKPKNRLLFLSAR